MIESITSWAAGASAAGFAAWIALSLIIIILTFVLLLYWGLIKTSDFAKSATRALIWIAITIFSSLMIFWAAVWG